MKKCIVLGIVFLFVMMSFTSISGSSNNKLSKSVQEQKNLSLISEKFMFDGNTSYVGGDGPNNYTSIQDAVDNASDGDYIFVYYGKYNEKVNVNKRLSIIGIESEDGEKPIVDAQLKGIVFKLNAQGSIIDGFVAQNAGKPFDSDRVCFSVRAKDCIIRNNVCRGTCYGGIRLMPKGVSDGTQVLNNKIYGGDFVDGIIMPYASTGGSKHVNISGNYIRAPYPMEIWAGYHNVIYRNYITNGLNGMWVQYGGGNQIIENTVTKCGEWGIRLAYVYNFPCQVLRNNISSNNGHGIWLWINVDDIVHTVKDNKIHANSKTGIYIIDTRNCEIIGNNITHNKRWGIVLSKSINNKIFHNDIIFNSNTASDPGNNFWDDGYPSGGNFWNDYNGIDSDGDGIGDTPYNISGGYNKDHYPLIESYGNLRSSNNGPYYKFLNDSIQFNGFACGGNPPYTWFWTFGDGKTSAEQNPIHTYANVGRYIICLSVTDENGNTSVHTSWTTIQETNDEPDAPTINGPIHGRVGNYYDYTFVSEDFDENEVWFYIEWGDGQTEDWIGPYDSEEEVTISYKWSKEGTFIIQAQARDGYKYKSNLGTLEVTIPRDKATNNVLLLRILERFPLLWRVVSRLNVR